MASNRETLEIVAQFKDEIKGELRTLRKDVRGLGDDTKRTDEELKKSTRTTKLMRVAVVGLGVAAVATGVQLSRMALRFGRESIAAAANAEELQGAFEAVFKGVEDEAELTAQRIAAIGRATGDVKEGLIGFQDTFVPMGFAREEALELSEALVQLGIDLAAFRNQDDAETFTLLSSAIVGNHEAVRRFGIILTEERLKLEAFNLGITEQVRELNALEKVQTRVALIFQDTADAQGAAAREFDSANSKVRRFQAGMKELRVEIGEELLDELVKFIDEAGGVEAALDKIRRCSARHP